MTILLCIVAGVVLWWLPVAPVTAQLPPGCVPEPGQSVVLADNGYADLRCYPECQVDVVDLRTCLPNAFGYIPLDILVDGYWGAFGEWVPKLVPYEADSFWPPSSIPGLFHIRGNVLDYDAGMMDYKFNLEAERLGLDPNNYSGGIAGESCGHIGYSIWVVLNGVVQNPDGKPALHSDCRARIHKYGAACEHGTIADLVYSDYGWEGVSGAVKDVEFYIAPPGVIEMSPELLNLEVSDYKSEWLEEAGMTCPV